jgi:uncharacterized protein
MSQNPYYLTLNTMTKTMKSLIGILGRVAEFAESKGMTEEQVLNLRLAPDMLPFSRQIQIVADNAKGFAASMGGVENPSMEDTETTIKELEERLQKTIYFVNSVDAVNFDEAPTRTKTFPWAPGKYIDAQEYLSSYSLPNFYFHATIAYAILRNNGMQLGKMDFIGGLDMKDL